MEFVSFLKSPAQYERLGAKIPKVCVGLLLLFLFFFYFYFFLFLLLLLFFFLFLSLPFYHAAFAL